MSMWRQYIVLRDRSGHTARGFVKLFFTHQACNVSASLSRMPKGEYRLCIWDGQDLASWPMHFVGQDLRLQAKHRLENGRIEAAVIDAAGRLAALGESTNQRADWGRMQARIDGMINAVHKTQQPDRSGKTAPAAALQTQPERQSTGQEPPIQRHGSVQEENQRENRTQVPIQPPQERSTPQGILQGEEWEEDCATKRYGKTAQTDWTKEPISMQRIEREEDFPLIERLLKQAKPMDFEQQTPAQPPIEEIAERIKQEILKNDAAEPIIIGNEKEDGDKEMTACIKQAMEQAGKAETEPDMPTEPDAKAQQQSPCVPEEPDRQEIDEPEQEPEPVPEQDQPEQETPVSQAPMQERTTQTQAEQIEQTENKEDPSRGNEQEKAAQAPSKPPAVQGPMLGGAYAGQWCWKRVEMDGAQGYYLLGCVERQGVPIAMAVAVPGAYAPQPPAYLQGFSIYRDGYWVLAQDGETGRTLAV